MPQSLANILTHVVFSTKNRQRWLHKDICQELYPYINKILGAPRSADVLADESSASEAASPLRRVSSLESTG